MHDPDCITPGKKAIEALRLMEDGHYRHLPIVEETERSSGLFRVLDLSGLELDRHDEETGLWERI